MIFLLPLAASAAVAAAPAAVATASVGATITSIATNLAMNVAISSAMSALQPKVGGSGRMSDWMLDEDSPIPFAAGRVGVSGAAVYQKTFGPDLMYKGVVSVLSGAGPIDGYESFKADEEAVTFDGNGKAVTSQYSGELWLKRTLGAQPDVALSSPAGLKNGSTMSGWSVAHKLSGKAAAMHVMGENSKYTAFPTGEIKGLHVLRGLKGWDPRLDSTYPGGLGACRLNDPSTWVYITNPIIWALKWSLGLWEGPTLKGAPAHGSETDFQVGGIGAKLSGIDVPAFVSAANIADANGWTVSGYPTTDDDKHEVLKSFLQAGGAVYAQRAGRISCISRAAPRASIVTITGADTAGELQLDTGASRIDRINTIRPRVISEAHNWQLTAIPKVSAQSYRDADGGTRPRGLDYTYVSKPTQGAQLAALEIANTREPMAGIVPLMPWLQKIKPGDAFEIDDPDFVLNGLKCLCLNTEFDPATKSVMVTFVSETDAKYPFALGQTSVPPVPPALTPETHEVTPPQLGEWNLAAVDLTDGGVSVPILLFTGDVDNARAESVIFEYRPVGAADWSFAGSDDPTVVRKEGGGGTLTAGTSYEGAVSYRSGGRISTRLILGPVIAGTLTAGDVAPIVPANIAGTPTISITSTMSPDGTITSRLWGDWADAADSETYVVELDDGLVITPIEVQQSGLADLIVRIGGTYRYRVKGRSRTGHLSAAWSNWSANTFASGDSTAPGPVGVVGGAGNGVFPLVRQIGMAWANPTDKDLARVLIFRNTSGTGPNLTGEAPYGWSEGTRFFDGQAALGTTYYYWALTQDRTGNTTWASLVYLGSGQARRVSVASDDVLATDPLLVTGYGIASGIAGQGALATKSDVAWGVDLTGRPPELTDGRIGAGLTSDGKATAVNVPDVRATNELPSWYRARGRGIYQEFKQRAAIGAPGVATYVQLETRVQYTDVSGGVLVQTVSSSDGIYQRRGASNDASWGGWVKSYDQLNKPAFGGDVLRENGLVVSDADAITPLGISAGISGQGALATQNQASWSTQVVGSGKPSDNAGTSGVLTPIGSHTTVSGNTVSKTTGTHGAFEGGAVGVAQYGTAFISCSLLSVDVGGFWETILALDESPASFDLASQAYLAQYYATGPGVGRVRLVLNNYYYPLVDVPAVGANSRMTLGYDGTQVFVAIDGVRYQSVRAPAGLIVFPKVIDFYKSSQTAVGAILDVQHGAWSDVAASRTIDLVSAGPASVGNIIGNTIRRGGGGSGLDYMVRAAPIAGPCTVEMDINLTGYSLLALDTDPSDASYNNQHAYVELLGTTGQWIFSSTVAASASGVLGPAVDGQKLRAVYDGLFVSVYVGETLLITRALGQNLTLYPKWWAHQSGKTYTGLNAGSARSASVLGGNTYRGDTNDLVPQSQLRTPEGISAGFSGQTSWATLGHSTNRIQYIDDTGRMIDGRGLPLNAASGAGIVLDPTLPLTPGSNTSTQIAVAATTVTLVGGQVINIAASTISGLTANTAYAVFYDLLTSSCVAISSSATAYYTSANRYLALGYHRTAQAGGSYSPPPAPPPWGGGGIGNCAEEDALILMANAARTGPGEERRFGDLQRGDWVWTQHEDTQAWGAFEVEALGLAEGEPCCLLVLENGQSLAVTPDHRVRVEGQGFVHAKDLRYGCIVLGPSPARLVERSYAGRRTVVKATVREAHTYVANGLLSHNIKYVEP